MGNRGELHLVGNVEGLKVFMKRTLEFETPMLKRKDSSRNSGQNSDNRPPVRHLNKHSYSSAGILNKMNYIGGGRCGR